MFGKPSPAKRGRKDQRVRLGIECLEERAVPATFTLISENFDSLTVPNLPVGWSTATLAGLANNWSTTNVGGVFIGPIPSLPNRAAALDGPTFSDSVLLTPTVVIPNVTAGDPLSRGATISLTFNNAFDLEIFDAMVLEVSVNGGAFQDVTAVGAFVTGGYNSAAPVSPTPPSSNLTGRPVWNGTTFGAVATQVNFTGSFNQGDTVQLRWRVSSDNTVGSPLFDGVGVDDVVLVASSPFNPSPNERFAVGSGGTVQAQVFAYDAQGRMLGSATPFPGYNGELHTATGDVTGDGVDDIVVAPGAGFTPFIVAYDGATGALTRGILAFSPNYTGGINVAVGDVNGDGFGDIIATPSSVGIGTQVSVFSGVDSTLINSFLAFGPVSTSEGISVAAGDVNGDGNADIIVGAGNNSPPLVAAFNGASGALISASLAFPAGYTQGVNVAAGDFNGDGLADIVTSTARSASAVVVFNGASFQPIIAFFAYEPVLSQGGARIAVTDVDRDGLAELVTANGAVPGFSAPNVKRFNSNFALFDSFFPFEGVYMDGGFVG